MTEQQIQNRIQTYALGLGAYIVKVVRATKAGVPDLIFCLQGFFIAVEVKKPGKGMTILQKYNKTLIERAGGIHIVATSVNDVKKVLKNCKLLTNFTTTKEGDISEKSNT